MWGGSTSVAGWRRAERWGAKVERENFMTPDGADDLSSGVGSAATTNAYVRAGGYASAHAEAGVGGVAKVGGEARVGWGKHYDQKTVEARKGKAAPGKSVGEGATAIPLRGAQKSLGTGYVTVSATLSASGGPFSGDLTGNLEILRDPVTGVMRPTYLDAWFSASAEMPMNSEVGDKFGTAAKDLAPDIVKLVKTIVEKARSKDKVKAGRGIGHGIDVSEGVASALLKVDGSPVPAEQAALDFDLAEDEGLTATASLTLSVGVGVGFNYNARGSLTKPDVSIDISLSHNKSLDFSADVVGVSVSKGRRLIRLKIADGKVSWD
jgi:hypothetical protein